MAVESVGVKISEFHGRPEAYATVRGFLSTSAAQLVDTEKSRNGSTIHLKVLEQTPRGENLVADLSNSPCFVKKIPLELLGLPSGNYLLSANGVKTVFVIPVGESNSATSYSDREDSAAEIYTKPFNPLSLQDEGEWIDIKDTEFIEPAQPYGRLTAGRRIKSNSCGPTR